MDIKNLETLEKFCEKEKIQMATQEQTNEEWLDTLSTVDKAIWLSKVAEKLKGNVWMWENWLKENHNGMS